MKKSIFIFLVLTGLVLSGCGVSVSGDLSPDPCRFEPVAAVVGTRGEGFGGKEKAYVLIRHTDGNYYVINMETASARRVGGIKRTKPCQD